jgi:AcrR family transcriptional regulator
MCVILWPVAQLTFQRARTEENKRRRAAALVEAARSLAVETGVASVTLTAVAGRAGIHYSAVRRYFSSHKEVLMHLAAEGWVRFSETVCAELGESGPKSPAQVAETLASALAADTLFCDLLANLHLHLEHEVHIERVVEIRRTISAAAVEVANATQRALPALGRSGAFDILIAAYSLAAAFWQIANPPQRLPMPMPMSPRWCHPNGTSTSHPRSPDYSPPPASASLPNRHE